MFVWIGTTEAFGNAGATEDYEKFHSEASTQTIPCCNEIKNSRFFILFE